MRRDDTLSYAKDIFINLSLWVVTTFSGGFFLEAAIIDIIEETSMGADTRMLAGGAAGWLISFGLAWYYCRNDAIWQKEKSIERIALEINKALLGFNIVSGFKIFFPFSTPVSNFIYFLLLFTGGILSSIQFVELRNTFDFSIVPFREHRVLQPATKIETASWVFDRYLEITFTIMLCSKTDIVWTIILSIFISFLLMRKVFLSRTLWYTPLEIFGDSAGGLQRERLFTRSFINELFLFGALDNFCNENPPIPAVEAPLNAETTINASNMYEIIGRRIILFSGTALSTSTFIAIFFINDSIDIPSIVVNAAMAAICFIIFISHELGRGRPRGGYQQTVLPMSTNTQILLTYQLSDSPETIYNTGIQNNDNDDPNYNGPALMSSMSGSL